MNKRQLEVQKAALTDEKKIIQQLKTVYSRASKDCEEKIRELAGRTDMQNLQSIIYQQQYQQALKKQLDGILDALQSNSFSSIAEYLTTSYENGFFGTMYDLHGQGIPLIFPIDQRQVVEALKTDTQLPKSLYSRLGEDVDYLKKSIRAELSRGISNGSSWIDMANHIANGMNSPFSKAMNNAMRIARTEGHRIQNKAQWDTLNHARDKGADIVKQWDSTLDRRTRKTHQRLDGQIKELDEPFEVNGKKAMMPGGFGVPSEDIQCRCCMLQRARWALDDEELQTLKDRAAYYGLDKSKDFDDFKKNYIPVSKTVDENEDFAALTIGQKERKIIKGSKNPVKMNLNGDDCKASYTKYIFSDGSGASKRKAEGAFVFETKDGTKFIFREKMNSSHQTMTPEKAIELWQKVPSEVRVLAQKEIQFVDYYNPMDAYWRKTYKNFTHSYATGGKEITFYRYDYEHDEDYVIRTYCHEAGHFIDTNVGGSSNSRFSNGSEWTKAMKDDKILSGKKSPTVYGENSNVEDFAESSAEFVADQSDFSKRFPNRTKLLKRILNM